MQEKTVASVLAHRLSHSAKPPVRILPQRGIRMSKAACRENESGVTGSESGSADSGLRRILKGAAGYQDLLERYLFPVLLAVWPLWGTFSGIDVTDAGYSLGNYLTLKDGMWFFATFLANKVGAFLTLLPGGAGLLAMNVKTALFVSAAALASYYTLQRMIPGWMVFLGEMLAESLFWCPTVILYNVLSYVLLTFACLCLFRAVNGVPRRRGWYAAAGALLGINVFVRFSNALQVVLILAVWMEEYWSERKAGEVRRDTGACLLGYAAGAGAVLCWISLEYGFRTWLSAIMELFGIGGDYTFTDMLTTTLDAYGSALRWMLIMAACVIAGMFFFAMPVLRGNRGIKRLLYLAGILVLFRFYWGHGVFTTNYRDYWCMFTLAMMFVILGIVLDAVGIAGGFGATTDERFLAAMSLLLILLLPFGSNNYTFPILLDLFLIAPFALWMFRRIWQEFRRREVHFPWRCMTMALILALMVQGTLFHGFYSFRDGTDGRARTAQADLPRTKGMRTTPENAADLVGAYTFLRENGLTDRKLISYGDAPGLGYLFEMEPGLSTSWPDLASFPEETFRKEMTELGGIALAGHLEKLPVVILHTDADHAYTDEELAALRGGRQEERKAVILWNYLEECGYKTAYQSEHYIIKVAPECD